MVHTNKGPANQKSQKRGQWWEEGGRAPEAQGFKAPQGESEGPWWEESAEPARGGDPELRGERGETSPDSLGPGFEVPGSTPPGEITLHFGEEDIGDLELDPETTAFSESLGHEAPDEPAPTQASPGVLDGANAAQGSTSETSLDAEELALLESLVTGGGMADESASESEAASREPEEAALDLAEFEREMRASLLGSDCGGGELEPEEDEGFELQLDDPYASIDTEDFELETTSIVGEGRRAPGLAPPVDFEFKEDPIALEPEPEPELELEGAPEAINLRSRIPAPRADDEALPMVGELAIWEAPEEIGPLALLEEESDDGPDALTLPEGLENLGQASDKGPLWKGGPEAAPSLEIPPGELALMKEALSKGDGHPGAAQSGEAHRSGEAWNGQPEAPMDLLHALSVTGQEGQDFIDTVPFDIEELGARFHKAALDPKRFKTLTIEEVFLMEIAALRGLPFTLEHGTPETNAPSPVAPVRRPRNTATGTSTGTKARKKTLGARRPIWAAGLGAALLLGVLAVPIPIALDGDETPLGEELLKDPEGFAERIAAKLKGEEAGGSGEPSMEEFLRTSRGVSVLSHGQDGGIKALSGPKAKKAASKAPRSTTSGGKSKEARPAGKGRRGKSSDLAATLLPELQHNRLSAHPDSEIHHLEDLLEDASHAQRNYDYRTSVALYEEALDSIGPTIPWEMRVAVWKGSREAFLLRAEVILKDEYLVKEDCELARSYLLRAEELGATSSQLNAYLKSAKRCFTGGGGYR